MRKLAGLASFILAFILLMAGSARAQDTSRVQLDGGFLYTRDYNGGNNCPGGYGQGAVFLVGGWAAVGEVGGCGFFGPPSGVNVSMVNYVFGPRYVFRPRRRKLEPYVQGLFGGIHLNANCVDCAGEFDFDTSPALRRSRAQAVSPDAPDPTTDLSASANGFAMEIGAGMDVQVTNLIAIRAFEADWLLTRVNGAMRSGTGGGLELKFGVTVRLGGRS